jgi:hypothetical protein
MYVLLVRNFNSELFLLFCCLPYSLALKMEGRCTSETSIDIQWTARCYMPVDVTLQKVKVCVRLADSYQRFVRYLS